MATVPERFKLLLHSMVNVEVLECSHVFVLNTGVAFRYLRASSPGDGPEYGHGYSELAITLFERYPASLSDAPMTQEFMAFVAEHDGMAS